MPTSGDELLIVAQLRSAQPGLDPRVNRISKSISKRGWKSILLFWNRGGQTSIAESVGSSAILTTPTSLTNPSFFAMPFLLILFYVKCVLSLIKLRPSVCIAHQLDTLAPALLFRALRPEVKVVFDNEDVYSLMVSKNTPHLLQAAIRAVERRLAGEANLCLFPNSAMKNYLDLLGATSTLLVPNLPELGFGGRAGVKARRRTRDQIFTVVYFGLMTRFRGLETLIKAIGIVASDGVKVNCTLIGDGPILAQLKRLAEAEVGDSVHFMDRVSREEISDLVAGFDASAILNTPQDPMNWVGNPNKLYECMALGVPVIASNFGEISELVRTAGCGVLANPEDPESVAEAILRLSSDPALWSRLSKNGLKATKEKYSWEIVERDLLEAVGALVKF